MTSVSRERAHTPLRGHRCPSPSSLPLSRSLSLPSTSPASIDPFQILSEQIIAEQIYQHRVQAPSCRTHSEKISRPVRLPLMMHVVETMTPLTTSGHSETKEELTPDSTKSTQEKAKEAVTDTADRVAR